MVSLKTHIIIIIKYVKDYLLETWFRRGRDNVVVWFTTTCAISAYHH